MITYHAPFTKTSFYMHLTTFDTRIKCKLRLTIPDSQPTNCACGTTVDYSQHFW